MAPKTTIIDWSFSLERAGGNVETAEALFKIFIEDLLLATKQIARAYQKKDWHKLDEINHRLLGACYFCGAPQLKSTVQKIETKLRSEQTDDLAPLIEKVQQNAQDVITFYNSQQYRNGK